MRSLSEAGGAAAAAIAAAPPICASDWYALNAAAESIAGGMYAEDEAEGRTKWEDKDEEEAEEDAGCAARCCMRFAADRGATGLSVMCCAYACGFVVDDDASTEPYRASFVCAAIWPANAYSSCCCCCCCC